MGQGQTSSHNELRECFDTVTRPGDGEGTGVGPWSEFSEMNHRWNVTASRDTHERLAGAIGRCT